MHIAEGMLPAQWAVGWAVPAAVATGLGLHQIRRDIGRDPSRKPFYALLGSAVFIISLLPIPVPIAGTSSHPCGTPLAAILVGPLASTVLGGLSLFLQALLFAHGGLTTLGANIISEGLTGSLVGWAVFRLFRRFNLSFASSAVAAGLLGDLAVYLVTSAQLGLALHGGQPLGAAVITFFAAYLPTQLPLAIGEGIFTGFALRFVARTRPDILGRLRIPAGVMGCDR